MHICECIGMVIFGNFRGYMHASNFCVFIFAFENCGPHTLHSIKYFSQRIDQHSINHCLCVNENSYAYLYASVHSHLQILFNSWLRTMCEMCALNFFCVFTTLCFFSAIAFKSLCFFFVHICILVFIYAHTYVCTHVSLFGSDYVFT